MQLQMVKVLTFNSCEVTLMEKNQALHEILPELEQMVDVLLIAASFQPESEFLQVVAHLRSLEGFRTDFTRSRESASTICSYHMWREE